MNEWLSARQIAELLGMTKSGVIRKLGREKVRFREVPAKGGPGGVRREYHISCLPPKVQVALAKEARSAGSSLPAAPAGLADPSTELEIYSRAPEFNRRKADKYLQILKASAGLKGAALMEYITEWNLQNPEFKTSYPRIMDMRKVWREQGIAGLLGQYGKAAGDTVVKDHWFKLFTNLYLKEGAPSLRTCWMIVLGSVRENNPSLNVSDFPCAMSFSRRLKRDIPESSIYMARYGEEAWNRKYARYIERDYANVAPGECFVSDHAQVDVAVSLPNGRYCFPWVTVWRDFKTSKWLGWLIHPEPPNSDHIFQSFYYAVKEYGLPSYIYIDNGKDYRSRDFAGGRARSCKLVMDKSKTTAMVGLLGITVIFAIPRNAQAKPVERDFLKNKELFSKHLTGYRGGNVVERPEALAREIKAGDIIPLHEFCAAMDGYIRDILNKMPSEGKVLMGRSPDAAWNDELTERRFVSEEALKLFCMRTSAPCAIGRNGIMDSALGVRYWAEWMSGMKGRDTKVYLRRDVNSYQEAWVFRAEDDEYLGRAAIAETVAAIAKTNVEKKQLRDAMARKKRDRKIAKAYADVKDRPGITEILTGMKAGVEAIAESKGKLLRIGINPTEEDETDAAVRPKKIYRLNNTRMDEVIRKDAEMQKEGTYDLGALHPMPPQRKKIALFECDLEK